jgi:hypothetical protein
MAAYHESFDYHYSLDCRPLLMTITVTPPNNNNNRFGGVIMLQDNKKTNAIDI